MDKYFVWLPGLRGPIAQVWDEEIKMVDGKPVKTLTTPIALTDADFGFTIQGLSERYPYKAKP